MPPWARWQILFLLGSADMLAGSYLHCWGVFGLGGFAAGAALAALCSGNPRE